MSISKAFLDDLRERLTLSDLIGKYIKVTRAGREFKACCPFHKEKTASFTINDAKGFYHCFGCGAHGDVVRFLTDYANMNFIEAVEHLCGLAGVDMPRPDKAEDAKYKQRKTIYHLLKEVEEYYKAQLNRNENRKYKQYLIDRGFSSSDISTFGIGYAPQDGNDLKKKLEASGFKEKDMIDSGVFRVSQRNSNEFYQFFRNRIIFPVHDIRERTIAFSGRIIPENYGGPSNSKAGKYINSVESDVFHKGKTLYGLNTAIKSINNGEEAIVVEGQLDVIALHKAGFKGAVAPLGTALTEMQVQELWKRMSDVTRIPTLCFDGDRAGQKAASRALARIMPILKPDTSVKFAFLPEGHDPDSLIKDQGFAAMRKVLDESITLFDMLWKEESNARDLSQPEALAGLKVALNKRVREIEDVDIRELFISQIKQRFEELYSSGDVRRSGGNAGRKFSNPFKGGFRKQQLPPSQASYRKGSNNRVSAVKPNKLLQEKKLLALIINHPWLYEEQGERLGMFSFSNRHYNGIKEEILHIFEEENNIDYQQLTQRLIEGGFEEVLNDIFDKSLYMHASFVKPDTDDELVLEAWHEIWEIGLK